MLIKILYYDMMEHFEDMGGGIFAPIVGPIKNIANGIVKVGEMCGLLVEVFISIMKLIPNIFKPDKLLNDIIYGVTMGINSMIRALMEKMNSIGTDGSKPSSSKKGGIFGIDDSSKAICSKPSWINLLILVLCPPLALYLHLGKAGLSGIGPWMYAIFMVLLCSGMTYYMYYFPGFLFAALHILC
jgi:hypothetical protein